MGRVRSQKQMALGKRLAFGCEKATSVKNCYSCKCTFEQGNVSV